MPIPTPVPVLGSIGSRVDIEVRTGDALGPYFFTLTDPTTGVPINLTGGTLDASMSKQGDSSADITMSITVTDAVNGKATMLLSTTGTANLAAGPDYFQSAATYVWRLRFTDTLGNPQTLLFGTVYVATGVLP